MRERSAPFRGFVPAGVHDQSFAPLEHRVTMCRADALVDLPVDLSLDADARSPFDALAR
jgi:hypothetical protein